MGNALEYSVSLDVARALRDINTFAAALEGRLAGAANRAKAAIAGIERMRIRTPVDLANTVRGSLAARATPAAATALALAAGAAGRLTAPAIRPISPAARPGAVEGVSTGRAAAGGGVPPAAQAAVVAAREIANEARAAFAPLRKALSQFAVPGKSDGHGGGGPHALTNGRGGRGGIIDIDATVVTKAAQSAGTFSQAWQRATASIRAHLTDLRERARGIVANVNVGGALKSLGGLIGRLNDVKEQARKTREESEKGGGMLGSVGGMAKGVVGPLAALAAGYLSLSFAAHQFKESISQAADFEQLKVGFSVLLQSGDKAKAMLADLTSFADSTPLELPDIAAAARNLLAFGSSAGSVVGELRMLGDIAAAVQAPLGEIADIYGKARVQGRLFAEDIQQFTGRGIPITKELAKQLGVNQEQIMAMVAAGRVGFPELQKAFAALTARGGQFYGMQIAQGQTFIGKLSTMKDALGALYREFGSPILEPLKVGIAGITEILAGWKGTAQEWGQTLANVLQGALAIIKNGDAGAAIGTALKLGIKEALNVLYKGTMATVAALATGLGEGANVLVHALGSPAVGKLITDMLNVAGYSLVAIVQHGIADAVRDIYGMDGVAKRNDINATVSEMHAGESLANVQMDLLDTSLKELIQEATDAVQNTGEAWTKRYESAPNPFDTSDEKAKLASIINNANESNAPAKPIFYSGGDRLPYGAGAPFGYPDSEMPAPGSKPKRVSLSDAITTFYRGQQAKPEADPGEGFINGRPASLTLGGLRPQTLAANTRPLTVPWHAPMLRPTDLSARAESFIGSSTRPDPASQATARNTAEIAGFMARVVALLQNPPTNSQPYFQ